MADIADHEMFKNAACAMYSGFKRSTSFTRPICSRPAVARDGFGLTGNLRLRRKTFEKDLNTVAVNAIDSAHRETSGHTSTRIDDSCLNALSSGHESSRLRPMYQDMKLEDCLLEDKIMPAQEKPEKTPPPVIKKPKAVDPIPEKKPPPVIEKPKAVDPIPEKKPPPVIEKPKAVDPIPEKKPPPVIEKPKAVDPIPEKKPPPVIEKPKAVDPIPEKKPPPVIEKPKAQDPIPEKKPPPVIEKPKAQDPLPEKKPPPVIEKPKTPEPIQEKKPPKLPEKNIIGKTILVEPPIYRKCCLWISPMPSSHYKNDFNSIPKPMNL